MAAFTRKNNANRSIVGQICETQEELMELLYNRWQEYAKCISRDRNVFSLSHLIMEHESIIKIKIPVNVFLILFSVF
jgi:hypothetical protein